MAVEPAEPSTRDRVEALVDAERGSRTPAPDTLDCVCDAMVLELEGVAATVSVVGEGGPAWVAGSRGEVGVRLVDLQATRGEGPAYDVTHLRRPVLVPDLGRTQGRWPGFAADAMALGACAVFAFPLAVGAANLGVLELARGSVGVLDRPQLVTALTFAEVATGHALDDLHATGWVDRDTAGGRPAALRPVVHQAQGMVMVTLGVSIAEALVRMRAHAFAHDLDLDDLARDIVAGRVWLDGQ